MPASCHAYSNFAVFECTDLVAPAGQTITYSPSNCVPGELREGCNATYECTQGQINVDDPTRTCRVNNNGDGGEWTLLELAECGEFNSMEADRYYYYSWGVPFYDPSPLHVLQWNLR